MDKTELRKECSRLFYCNTISDCQELLNIYAEFFFQIVNNHNPEIKSRSEFDSTMVLQMMMTKALHLRNAISGISYESNDGRRLNNIIDPTVVASLIRNIYETTGMFNLIYRTTSDPEERKIIYLLWVHAGLSYRQRFNTEITTEDNAQKAQEEKEQMLTIVNNIENNSLYKKLDETNQKRIKHQLKTKDYLIKFDDLEVKILNWRQLTETMDIKNGKLDHAYGYFSLYSHPSNVSVFQFADMFAKENESFRMLTLYNLKIAFFMFSIFIADYINLFPETLKTYESLGLVEQIVINFHNRSARGVEYSINNSYEATQ
ncbi:hypothetical protein HNP99_002087 [Flavobacterium sp. 28A]|uniref:hypothetical protein n=1 Tax=Flavobacterium sp. 28A TaxID=2735895 RepID=UPI00157145E4|nr:hypothetical protein [Flavobacterium sp. 28A]NRT15730.1 hypothetical protein [Flavobacterium sp. 28A]